MSDGGGCRRISTLALAALLGASGVLHFTHTGVFATIVPRALGKPRLLVQVSGIAELACAALLLPRTTRHWGGWASAALLVAVFPANVQMALDGGAATLPAPLNSATAAWLRLPLQLPLVAAAVAVARSGSAA